MSLNLYILLPLGLAVTFTGVIALLSLGLSLGSGKEVSERLETYAYMPDPTPRRDPNQIRKRMTRVRFRLNSMLSMFTSEELSLRLASANWPITETEYILIRIWGAVAGFILDWVISRTILPGIGLAVIAQGTRFTGQTPERSV